MSEKKKSDVVQRLLAKLDRNPELKAKIDAKINMEFSALGIIHGYLRGTHEFNERHMEEFAEYCIKETLKNQRYIPATILFGDWLKDAENKDQELKDILEK